MKKLFLIAALLALPTCTGIPIPDSDGDGIPDIIDPCPTNPDPTCVPGGSPGGPYDCTNPPAMTGLVKVKNPVKDKYIVVLRGSIPLGVNAIRTFSVVNAYATKLSIKDVIKLLQNPNVKFIQQVGTFKASLSWGLDRVDQRDLPLDKKFISNGTGEGVQVAIIDTGVDSKHSEFTGRMGNCFTAITFGGCEDQHDHGTHVAGTVAGTTFGIAKKATIHAVRVLDSSGSGTTDQVVAGIDWVTQQKKETGKPWVANMSLGGSSDPVLDQAVCNSIAAGVTYSIAAGNDSADACDSSPARVMQAITLGASDDSDTGAYFTNVGKCVTLFGPGVDIESAKRGGGSVSFSGTSMATPHSTGISALTLFRHPAYSPAQVKAAIFNNASKDKLKSIGDSPNLLLYANE